MEGHVYLSLLNPSIAFSFAILVAVLWHRWPAQTQLFPLSLSFLYLGLAFIAQDWPPFSVRGSINYAANALFFAAVLLICISALMRVRVKIPVVLFGLTSVTAIAGFLWFALVEPSTIARIYFANACLATLAAITATLLVGAGMRTIADRLFVAGIGLGAVLAAGRPLLVIGGMLDINAQGGVEGSAYWVSILGTTPFVAILAVSLFIFALVLDLMDGLQRDANQDYLTDLLNRRGFEIGAERRLGSLSGGKNQAGLLVADIDDFKRINDQYGHAVGDSVIAGVGNVLAQHGQADLNGRTGGEEFALFYDKASRRALEGVAEEVRVALGDLILPGLPPEHRLTVSIGLHLRQGDEGLADMMRNADRALYEAKAAGKNRAVLTPVRLRTV
jgi:diguanylate cyclase (GGDEF)-like protein